MQIMKMEGKPIAVIAMIAMLLMLMSSVALSGNSNSFPLELSFSDDSDTAAYEGGFGSSSLPGDFDSGKLQFIDTTAGDIFVLQPETWYYAALRVENVSRDEVTNARIEIDVSGGDNFNYWLYDTVGGKWYKNPSFWGPSNGFTAAEDYEATTLVFIKTKDSGAAATSINVQIIDVSTTTEDLLSNKLSAFLATTIGDALDAAEGGDTIIVYPGTYVEDVEIGVEELTLQSVKKHEAVIDGSVYISAHGVNLNGFKVDSRLEVNNTNGVVVSENVIKGTGGTAILTRGNRDIIIENNILENNICGIEVRDSVGATLRGNTIINSIVGVYLTSAKNALLENNYIADNEIGVRQDGVSAGTTGNILRYNNLENNTAYGVKNDGGGSVDARNNWWGHDSGPCHPTKNEDGKGDEVSNHVLFNPWLGNSVDYSYKISISGPSTAVVNQMVTFNVRTWSSGTYHPVEKAIYDYEITDGDGKLQYWDENKWVDIPLKGQFGPKEGFELTPYWDETTKFRFAPQDTGTYRAAITLKTMDGYELTAADYKLTVRNERIYDEDAVVTFTPRTLNLKAQGRWINARVVLPGYEKNVVVKDVQLEYNGEEPVKAERVQHLGNALLVRFNWAEVADILEAGTVQLTLTGTVNDSSFEGSDTVTVISPGNVREHKQKALKKNSPPGLLR